MAVGTNNNMTLSPASLGATLNNYIGKSQWPDPYLDGMIDEFRIYSVALSPAEIAATHVLGAGQLLSTDPPTLDLSLAQDGLTLSWPLASAGFRLQTRTDLVGGAWVDLSSPAPQILNGRWQLTIPVVNPRENYYRLAK
jgi:hypothetical protein